MVLSSGASKPPPPPPNVLPQMTSTKQQVMHGTQRRLRQTIANQPFWKTPPRHGLPTLGYLGPNGRRSAGAAPTLCLVPPHISNGRIRVWR